MKFRFSFLFILLYSIIILFNSCSGKNEKLHIIQINSLKGSIFPTEENGIKHGGFSLISGVINDISKKQPGPAIILAADNTIHGTPEAYFSQGENVIKVMNSIGFSAMLIGPREFYYGKETLAKLANLADFPFISANLVKTDGTQIPYIKPYIVEPDTNTAVIGISSETVLSRNLPEHVKGIKILDPEKTIRTYIQKLGKTVTSIIVIFPGLKLSSADDRKYAEMLASIPGVDALITGSRQKQYTGLHYTSVSEKKTIPRISVPDGQTDFGKMLTHIIFSSGKKETAVHFLAANENETNPDPELREIMYITRKNSNDLLGQVLGESKTDISHNHNGESDLGNIICDILRDYTNTNIVLLNSGSLRNGFSKGDITSRELYSVIPFGGNLVVIEITGKQLLKILEHSTVFKNNPDLGRGFLQVSGISFAFNPNQDPGKRLIKSSVNIYGKQLQENKMYTLATDRYIFEGGDGYTEFMEMNIQPKKMYAKTSMQIILEAIRRKGTISIPDKGRIKEVAN